MVWPFSSSSTSDGAGDQSVDPYSKLDPTLRKFLERESPVKYSPTKPPERELTAREQVNLVPTPKEAQNTRTSQPTPPTLFPDGRYAHLWKNYRPQADIDNEHKSDQEKLSDVLSAWKDRKKSISKAALENCASINYDLDYCFRRPNLTQRATMCRAETRALDRCFTMNQRFLKALGYLSSLDRSEEEEEAIQMHADKLYTRMLEQEKEMAAAKAEGREVPAQSPSFDIAIGNQRPPELDKLTERGKQALEQRVKGLSPAEKDLEERAFAAELRAGTQTLEQLEKYRDDVRQARAERIESGKERSLDRFKAWLGW